MAFVSNVSRDSIGGEDCTVCAALCCVMEVHMSPVTCSFVVTRQCVSLSSASPWGAKLDKHEAPLLVAGICAGVCAASCG
jgi:hypothetical protein